MEERMKSVMLKTGLSEKALRLYIDKGLIQPIERVMGNRRNFFFDESQIKKLKQIALLRKYDFSLNEIKCLYDNKSCTNTIISDYLKRIYEKYSYYNNINDYIQNIDIENIDNIDSFIKILYEMEDVNSLNKTYFMFFDESIDEKFICRKKFNPIYITVLLIGVIASILLGALIGYNWCKQNMVLRDNIIQYGVVEQNLSVHSILWKDYPAYKELSFTIDGSISFHTKRNGTIALNNLVELSSFEEKSRECNVSSNGSDLLYYDYVTYNLHDSKIVANIPKIYNDNSIISIVGNSYYLIFNENDAAYVVGCINACTSEYVPWTIDEIRCSTVNLDAYLPAFTLSRTYDSINPLHQKIPKEGIKLNREGGNCLSYTMYNSTMNDWCYENQLPHIELWYKGIWIELNSPFDYNLTSKTIDPLETISFEVSNEILKQYPSLFQGIYRLVIYGENEEFIVSNTFFYGGTE